METNIGAKNVRLRMDIAETVPQYLLGDAFRLQQVLINLGGNAIKFTEQGEVSVSVSLDGTATELASIAFSVSDTGIGISPENQEKIFGSFAQAEASTSRRFGGSGLGLSISQHLVELMGGDLQLKSEPGVGSCFFFTIALPLASEKDFSSDNDFVKRVLSDQRLKGMRILVAEDNMTNQQIARELLESEGARVLLANDGQQLIQALRAALARNKCAPCDVILMDMQMPVMDGLEATRQLREMPEMKNVPVIAMTANAMQSDRDACIDAGMNDHVGKPFDLDYLIQVLHRHVHAGAEENVIVENLTESASENRPSNGEDEIVDLDYQGAIARFGGNAPLYYGMLPKLQQSLQNCGEQLAHATHARQWDAAKEILHTLKGVAATVGLVTLAKCADNAERQMKETEDDSNYVQSLSTVQNQIAKALPCIDAMIITESKKAIR